MELDVSLNSDSISIPIGNPYSVDVDQVAAKIENFASAREMSLAGIDIRGLIPKMIRGIAGCEGGCPANAKSLVKSGYENFELEYIEGGILSARATTDGGAVFELKMFPDF